MSGIQFRSHAREQPLHRFFPSFLGASRGAALLLLRAVAGGVATLHGLAWLDSAGEPFGYAYAIGGAAVAAGLALLVGLATPLAAIAVGISLVLGAAFQARVAVAATPDAIHLILIVADAAALVLLGPGAFALDAHLFGRREVIIPNDRQRR